MNRDLELAEFPTRRVILLGASNLVRSLSIVVETARQTWREPVEIMAAIGHGRSYGQDSTLCGRKFSGIFPCALWQDLQNRPPLPTFALVTDVGNDILYGVPVERLLEWVEACLARLAEADATTVLTQLPIESVAELSDARFRLFRTLWFPRSRLTLSAVRESANTVNQRLVQIAAPPKISVISVSKSWYGFDPIHLKRSAAWHAWPAILSAWCDGQLPAAMPRASIWRAAYLHCLAPSERTVFGWRRCSAQPCGRLNDGTTIALY